MPGSTVVVDGPETPDGPPSFDTTTENVGSPISVPVVVPGTPVTTFRTVNGTPTSTEAAGSRNCERVNNENGARPVERCERTVITTTTTPTTIFTTVTTPQTEITTTTQQREECVTTIQPTSFVRTSTTQTTRTQTVTTPQSSTQPTLRQVFAFNGGGPSAPLRTVPESTTPGQTVTPAADLVVVTQVPGTPIITPQTLPGDPIITGPVCTPTTPDVDVTSRTLDPLVVTTNAPGAPIVSTSTDGTGQTCMTNPSTAQQRRNAC